MSDDQREPRVADSSEQTSADEPSNAVAAAVTTVARMLANPRRIRRD